MRMKWLDEIGLKFRWLEDLNIGSKLGISVTVTALLPLLLVGLLTNEAVEQVLLANAVSAIHHETDEVAGDVDAFLEEVRSDLRFAVRQAVDGNEAARGVLADFSESKPRYHQMRFTDAQGRDNPVSPSLGRKSAEIGATDVALSELALDQLGEPAIRATVTVRDKSGGVMGTMNADVALGELARRLSIAARAERGAFSLVSESGEWLIRSDSSTASQGLGAKTFAATYPEIMTAWRLGSHSGEFNNLRGEAVAFSAVCGRNEVGPCILVVDSATRVGIIDSLSDVRAVILVLFLSAALLAVTLGFWLSGNWIVAPLGLLLKAANAFADGSLSTRVGMTHQDEIGRLGRAFDSMGEALQDSYEKLEQRVLQRTWELRDSQEQLAAAQRQLLDAIEGISEGFVLFDPDDRLVLFNSKYREFMAPIAEFIVPGVRFEELLQASVERKLVVELLEDPDEWACERMERHRNPAGVFEQRLADGRWILFREYATRDGGRVGIRTDITYLKEHEAALAEQSALLRATVDSIAQGISVFDRKLRLAVWNQNYLELQGFPEDFAQVGTHFETFVRYNAARGDYGPGDIERLVAERIAQAGRFEARVFERVRSDGTVMEVRSAPMQGGGLVTTYTDITGRVRIERDLRKLSRAVEQSPVAVVITDTRGSIEYVNPKFVEATGYEACEVIGQNARILKSGHNPPDTYRDLWANITAGRDWRGELHNKKKNGSLFWEFALISPIKSADGTITNFLAVKEDITVRKEYEERLLHQANYDDLTHLPNRILALDRLSQALARARRNGHAMALMFVDLDQFKKVNDTLGHAAGDKLLVEAAHRLTNCVRESDTVARLGGDEFLIILPEITTPVYSDIVAERILETFSRAFNLESHEIVVTASIGLTVFPDDGDDAHVLLRNADAAMYRAKEMGRNAYRFFTPEMNRQALERLALESRLRHALDRQELFLHFQPVMDPIRGTMIGAEALLRWRNPELGMVPPDRFISVAEETGVIVPIGEWVLYAACREARRWQELTSTPITIAVNVSSRQFRGADLVHTVIRALDDSGLPARCLELEITESLLVEDARETTQILQELTAMGVRFSIDDFGTGYSSLSYLKRFPVSALKIDRSFVRDVITDPSDATLCNAIIAMAHSLGLKVVGEGVETQEQLDFLRGQGCDYVQGYYYSKPLAPKDLHEFILKLWPRV